MSTTRTRWAAVGAAVAVSLGAGGIGLVSASVGSGDKPVTVLLDAPCRLLDTRPAQQGTVAVPSRSTPLGAGEAYTVTATASPLGNCDLTAATLGTTITGLVTNVTPVLPTAATDVRLYPTGAAVPETSNLNPVPGQPPTPNAVTVGLNGSGQFDILNKFGEVHVIVDVVGFLADHHHDDRYYTKSEVGAALGTKANTADVYTKSESDARYPQGYAAVYQDFTSTAWPDGELRSFSTNCPAGLTPTGGGVSSSGYGLVMDSDFPHPYKSATPTGWRAWMRNVSGSQITSIEVSVHVICMDIPNQSGAASAPLTPPLAAVPASDSADRNS